MANENKPSNIFLNKYLILFSILYFKLCFAKNEDNQSDTVTIAFPLEDTNEFLYRDISNDTRCLKINNIESYYNYRSIGNYTIFEKSDHNPKNWK